MPERKKKANEMTTEELARRVFPKKVVDELKKIAHQNDEKTDREKPNSDSSH